MHGPCPQAPMAPTSPRPQGAQQHRRRRRRRTSGPTPRPGPRACHRHRPHMPVPAHHVALPERHGGTGAARRRSGAGGFPGEAQGPETEQRLHKRRPAGRQGTGSRQRLAGPPTRLVFSRHGLAWCSSSAELDAHVTALLPTRVLRSTFDGFWMLQCDAKLQAGKSCQNAFKPSNSANLKKEAAFRQRKTVVRRGRPGRR